MRKLPPWLVCAWALPLLGAEEPDRLEAVGEGEWSLAVPRFRVALEAWDRVASHAQRLRDTRGVERSYVERTKLAALLRDARLLELLRGEAASPLKPGTPVPASPLFLDGGAVARNEPASQALDKLSRFLQGAGRRYAKLPRREEHDLILLAEADALAHRLLGEVHQVRADLVFGNALSLVDASPVGPERTMRRVRLLSKLRDFAGVRAAQAEWPVGASQVGASPAGASRIGREDLVAHLATLRDAALFEGDAARAGAIREEIRKLSGKEEEPARPGAKFQSLLLGSMVDLAETAQTLILLMTRHRLGTRERDIVSLLAGEAAMELGEHALGEEILRGARAAEDPWLRASLLGRLGMARVQLGDYEPAVHDLEDARLLAAGVQGSDDFISRATLNLSKALLGLGEADRARGEALDVLKRKDLPADLRVRGRILIGSSLYEAARDAPQLLGDAEAAFLVARRELDAARKQVSGAGEPTLEAGELDAMISINLANILRLRAVDLRGDEASVKRQEALSLQDKALRTADAAKLWPLAAVAAANLGELYLEGGDVARASSFVEWALTRAREHRLFETEWRCLWYLGRIADTRGDGAAADVAFAHAATVIESYRSRILDAEKKSGFLTDKMAFYRDLVRRELKRGRADLALGAAERAKARGLVDSLGWRFVALADSRDTALYREYVSLVARSERLRERVKPALFGVEAKDLGYEDLRARLAALKTRLIQDREYGPALRSLIDGDPSDAASILGDLPPRSTLVEYFCLGDSFVALVVAGGRVEAIPLEVAPRVLDALVTAYVRGGAGDASTARRLYSLLIAPLEGRLSGERLVVVPYGSLHQLPFETLRDEKGYLVSRWDLIYLPSASVLKHLKRRDAASGRPPTLLAVVDPNTDYNRDGKPDMPPLPHAREEVAGFAPSFGQKSLLVGAEALKLACQRDASMYDVIHYACHGEFYPARPWDSSLFLAPGVVDGVRDDGRLRASEVYALDLRRSRLVALSGCETGRSQVSPGDDAVSIGTAFLHSGASSLLVSLWKVEDQATAALMKAFYEKWVREGKDRGRALRESKIELMASRFPHPRQWGAFVLMGEP